MLVYLDEYIRQKERILFVANSNGIHRKLNNQTPLNDFIY